MFDTESIAIAIVVIPLLVLVGIFFVATIGLGILVIRDIFGI